MLAILGTVLSSILSGGATGLLGIVIQRFFDAKSKSQDLELVKINNAHALALADKEVAKVETEWKAREKIADKDLEARIQEATQATARAESEASAIVQQASYAADKASYLTTAALKSKSRLVMWLMAGTDAVRGLIRPVLTGYLVVVVHMMYADMQKLMSGYGATLPHSVVQELLLQIISTLLYLATVAVVWWFGTRPPTPTKR